MSNIEKLQLIPSTGNLTADIKAILTEARSVTVRSINTMMVSAYWLIDKHIVVEEQKGSDKAAYGEGLLKKLSKELTAEFGNGFSYANLRNMRQFYLTYNDSEICQTLSNKWSVRQLERNINSFYYQRQLKYSVLNESKQIFASKYLPYLPTEEELKLELESSSRMKEIEE